MTAMWGRESRKKWTTLFYYIGEKGTESAWASVPPVHSRTILTESYRRKKYLDFQPAPTRLDR